MLCSISHLIPLLGKRFSPWLLFLLNQSQYGRLVVVLKGLYTVRDRCLSYLEPTPYRCGFSVKCLHGAIVPICCILSTTRGQITWQIGMYLVRCGRLGKILLSREMNIIAHYSWSIGRFYPFVHSKLMDISQLCGLYYCMGLRDTNLLKCRVLVDFSFFIHVFSFLKL